MRPNTFAPHELLELHELISSEVTNAEKLQVNIGMVNDSEIKTFMQMCLKDKQTRISKMTQLVTSVTGTAIQ